MTDQFTQEQLRVAEEQVANESGIPADIIDTGSFFYEAEKVRRSTTIEIRRLKNIATILQAQVNAQESELSALRERVEKVETLAREQAEAICFEFLRIMPREPQCPHCTATIYIVHDIRGRLDCDHHWDCIVLKSQSYLKGEKK